MKKIARKNLILFILLLPFFNPTALKFIPSTVIVYNIIQWWKLISIFCIFYLYLRYFKISKIIVAVALFCLYYILTTFINNVDNIREPITDSLVFMGISMLTEMAIIKGFNNYCKVMFSITFTLSILNLLTCIMFPSGIPAATLYTNKSNPLYLLGIDNAMIKNLMPLLVLSFYPFNKTKRLSLTFLCTAIALITLYLTGSMTGLLAGVFFVFFAYSFLFFSNDRVPALFFPIMLTVIMLLLVIGSGRFHFVDNILSLFGRSGTFTGRATLWRMAIDKISQKWLFGYGYTSGNLEVWGGMYSSHNLLLELAIHGGILLPALFLFVTLYALYNLRHAENLYHNFVALGILTFLIVGLMETGINNFYFVLLAMAYRPVKRKEKQNRKTDIQITDGQIVGKVVK